MCRYSSLLEHCSKTYNMMCAASKDSDQTEHPWSLIWVFAVCIKKAFGPRPLATHGTPSEVSDQTSRMCCLSCAFTEAHMTHINNGKARNPYTISVCLNIMCKRTCIRIISSLFIFGFWYFPCTQNSLISDQFWWVYRHSLGTYWLYLVQLDVEYEFVY